jgi:hypothetical protein
MAGGQAARQRRQAKAQLFEHLPLADSGVQILALCAAAV